jgi:hypothetical protein
MRLSAFHPCPLDAALSFTAPVRAHGREWRCANGARALETSRRRRAPCGACARSTAPRDAHDAHATRDMVRNKYVALDALDGSRGSAPCARERVRMRPSAAWFPRVFRGKEERGGLIDQL